MFAFIFSCYKVWPFKQFPVHNCWSLHSSKMGLWSWQWLWWQFWWASKLWYVNTVLYLFLILTAEGSFHVYLLISNYLFICGNLKVCFAEVDLKLKSLHGTLYSLLKFALCGFKYYLICVVSILSVMHWTCSMCSGRQLVFIGRQNVLKWTSL